MALGCNSAKNASKEKKEPTMIFTNVTQIINPVQFEKIKKFILQKGDRKTFRNYDNYNPHYKFSTFDAFLGADTGQMNINNDPELSDFNELTLSHQNPDIPYYTIVLVRNGDLKSQKAHVHTGMKENQVYLVNVSDVNIELIKEKWLITLIF
jgi:signal peptidase I